MSWLETGGEGKRRPTPSGFIAPHQFWIETCARLNLIEIAVLNFFRRPHGCNVISYSAPRILLLPPYYPSIFPSFLLYIRPASYIARPPFIPFLLRLEVEKCTRVPNQTRALYVIRQENLRIIFLIFSWQLWIIVIHYYKFCVV